MQRSFTKVRRKARPSTVIIIVGGKDDGNSQHDSVQAYSSAHSRLSAGAATDACLQPFSGV